MRAVGGRGVGWGWGCMRRVHAFALRLGGTEMSLVPSRALPEYPRDPHAMQADTRGCGDAHTACCVHMWCLIARPLERDWVCVWRGAGGRGGGDGAGWHALRGRGKLRLIQCVPRTVRNGARLRRSSLDKVCRDNPPPISWSACSHELPMCVRGHMRMGMCVCARVRRKYLFVVLNKVETD